MINKKLIKNLAKTMNNIIIIDKNMSKLNKYKHLLESHWLKDSTYKIKELSDKDKLLFLLILDATSFSYWGKPNWKIKYNKEEINGARAMILALRKAVDNGKLELSAKYLENLSRKKYREILIGTTEIPLFEERYQIIKEIGKVLTNKFSGDIKNLIKLAKCDALKLVDILIGYFDFFKDYIIYEGEIVELNKKAQLFVLDIYRIFDGKGIGKLTNIKELTALADYKLPQILRRLGIFKYSPELAKRIDNHIPLPSGSQEEIEIRLKTIFVVERIKDYLNKSLKINIKSCQVNELLWILGQIKHKKNQPYHKVRTTKY